MKRHAFFISLLVASSSFITPLNGENDVEVSFCLDKIMEGQNEHKALIRELEQCQAELRNCFAGKSLSGIEEHGEETELILVDPTSKRQRTMQDPLKENRMSFWEEYYGRPIGVAGLRELPLSASGQLTAKEFKILQQLAEKNGKKHVLVIDARREPHGFIEGIPFSWWMYGGNKVNATLDTEVVLSDEAKRLSGMVPGNFELFIVDPAYKKGGKIYNAQSFPLRFPETYFGQPYTLDIYSESELMKRLGFLYKRLDLQDHGIPSIQKTEEIVRFFEKEVKELVDLNGNPISKDSIWFHVHCRKGMGRSTTIAYMIDLLSNRALLMNGEITPRDVIGRQYAIGGVDLFNSKPIAPEKNWKAFNAMQRDLFASLFAHYVYFCKDNDMTLPEYSWSHFLEIFCQGEDDPTCDCSKSFQNPYFEAGIWDSM